MVERPYRLNEGNDEMNEPCQFQWVRGVGGKPWPVKRYGYHTTGNGTPKDGDVLQSLKLDDPLMRRLPLNTLAQAFPYSGGA